MAAILIVDGPGTGRWVGTGIAAVLVAGSCLARRWTFTATTVLLAVAAGALHLWRLEKQQLALGMSLPQLEAKVRIITPPKIGGRGWSGIGRDEQGALWWFRGVGMPPQQGEKITAGGSFSALEAPRNPGEFDFRDWAHRKGISGVFSARSAQRTVETPPWLTQQAVRLQNRFSEAIVDGCDPVAPETAVIRGMLLGEVPQDPAVSDPFRYSGVLHAFSVSGLHIDILVFIGSFLLAKLLLPRRWAILVLILGTAFYVWITGVSMPATRAFIMAFIGFGAFLLRRRRAASNVLGLALLAMVLPDGHLVFHPGVQLSFGVVAAIVFLSPYTIVPFRWIMATDPYLPPLLFNRWQRFSLWLRGKIAKGLAASTAGMFGSLPMLVGHFGILSWISILACLCMGPLILFIMAVAFVSATLSFIPPVSKKLNWVNFHLAHASLWVAQKTAAIPGGHFQIPLDRPGKNFLIVYDPGSSSAAAVLHDDDATVLFDTAKEFSFKNLLAPSLQHLALTPTELVLSHPDSGHIGGALAALSAYPIRGVILPVEKARSKGYQGFVAALPEHGVPRHLGVTGEVQPLSPHASLQVIHVAGPELAKAIADQRVMVTRLDWRGWRILFTSDTGWTEEDAMIASGVDLRADVIVMGRNSRDGSASDAFLQAVKPQVIVAAHADFPAAARIPEAWRQACEDAGIRVLHQGHTGAVSIVPKDDGTLELSGFVDGSKLVLRHR